MANYNEKGEEIPDKKPVAMPLGYERPEPLEKMVQRMVRVASNHSAAMGNETLEEANDFGEEDEDELSASPYQYQTMEEEYLDEESRTSAKGHTTASRNDESNPDKNGGEVQKSGSPDREEQPRNRRAEDKAWTNQRRERRQAADNQEDRGQGQGRNIQFNS